MPIRNRICETCEKPFVAEGGWSKQDNAWVFASNCYDCDAELHRKVDELLRKRGHPEPENNKGPKWYDQ